jgi:hypothetical protein
MSGVAPYTKNAYTTGLPKTAFTGTTNNTGAHTHQSDGPSQFTHFGSNSRVAWEGTNKNRETSSAGAHTHTLTIDGGGDTTTRPDNVVLAFIIKAADRTVTAR